MRVVASAPLTRAAPNDLSGLAWIRILPSSLLRLRAESGAANERYRGRHGGVDQIEMAVDAGHAPLPQQRVGGLTAFARGPDIGSGMAASAGETVLATHELAHLMRERNATRVPDLGVAEVVGVLRPNVAHPRRHVGVGLG